MALPLFKHIPETPIQPINMTKKEIIADAIDAVTASGKDFTAIEKNSFFAFFEKQGVPKNLWDSIYNELRQYYNPNTSQGSASMDATIEKMKKEVSHDYLNSKMNEVKKRTPRKNIFGEISKIAG